MPGYVVGTIVVLALLGLFFVLLPKSGSIEGKLEVDLGYPDMEDEGD